MIVQFCAANRKKMETKENSEPIKVKNLEPIIAKI